MRNAFSFQGCKYRVEAMGSTCSILLPSREIFQLKFSRKELEVASPPPSSWRKIQANLYRRVVSTYLFSIKIHPIKNLWVLKCFNQILSFPDIFEFFHQSPFYIGKNWKINNISQPDIPHNMKVVRRKVLYLRTSFIHTWAAPFFMKRSIVFKLF